MAQGSFDFRLKTILLDYGRIWPGASEQNGNNEKPQGFLFGKNQTSGAKGIDFILKIVEFFVFKNQKWSRNNELVRKLSSTYKKSTIPLM